MIVNYFQYVWEQFTIYATLTNIMKYFVMCKVYTDVDSIKVIPLFALLYGR